MCNVSFCTACMPCSPPLLASAVTCPYCKSSMHHITTHLRSQCPYFYCA